MRLPTKQRN